MRKNIKKLSCFFVMLALSMAMTTAAFAGQDSETVLEGYGTLYGACRYHEDDKELLASAYLATNPDRAYLKIKVDMTFSDRTQSSLPSYQSERGETYYSKTYSKYQDGKTGIYAYVTSGVQGGSTYAAGAVYTNCSLINP